FVFFDIDKFFYFFDVNNFKSICSKVNLEKQVVCYVPLDKTLSNDYFILEPLEKIKRVELNTDHQNKQQAMRYKILRDEIGKDEAVLPPVFYSFNNPPNEILDW